MADHHPSDHEAHRSTVSDHASTAHKQFQRSYQACLPCRKRKVRCDLGPVDDPHDPPCARCRRESKDCVFSSTRRKRKGEGDDEFGEDDEDVTAESLARRKSVRRQNSLDDVHVEAHEFRRSITSDSIQSPSSSDPYHQPQNGPYGQSHMYGQSEHDPKYEAVQEQDVINEAANTLFQAPINSAGDAFALLLKATGQSEDYQSANLPGNFKREGESGSRDGLERDQIFTQATIEKAGSGNTTGDMANLDPAIMGYNPTTSPSFSKTLAIWSRLRFVRAGWFTVREAIAYIDYYYQYLAPLTPITHPDLREVHLYPDMLSEEPMLTVTLLTLASRYMKLQGAGSQTRSLMIHERLWHYLQDMTTRMFWAQEQFGGGFCGAGASQRVPKPTETGKLRTLGSIESLLLLSDFHPRSMHFPPNDDEEDVLAPDEEKLKGLSSAENDASSPGYESTFAGWTEPAVRSDRMSWSLIGFAHTLAYELGIFGTYVDGDISVQGQLTRPKSLQTDRKRADRIERLLFIYVTQACGRFGFPSTYPDHLTKHHMETIRRGFQPDPSLGYESADDVVQQFYVEVTAINKYCNDTLFPSKQRTAYLIQSGEYQHRLNELNPVFHDWQSRLEQSRVAKHPKVLLSIEAQYFRTFANGLALQAKIEQYVARNATGINLETSPQSPESTTSSSLSSLSLKNEAYIQEVIEASRKILSHVVDDLLPNDNLKFTPVRAYFRIVSAAMFLLKTFAVGAKRAETDKSLHLLDRTIKALRTSVVDDVHLCLRIADLLDKLTANIRRQFIQWRPERASSHQAKDADQRMFVTHQIAGPSEQQQQIRFVRQTQPTHTRNSPNPSYLGAPDSNITVMPPPRGTYNHNSMFDFSANNQQSPYHIPPSFSQQASPTYPASMNNGSPTGQGFIFPPAEDWMTLDLNPLAVNNNNSGNMTMGPGDDWWSSNVAPEVQNAFNVVDTLVAGSWAQQGQGGPDDSGGMGY